MRTEEIVQRAGRLRMKVTSSAMSLAFSIPAGDLLALLFDVQLARKRRASQINIVRSEHVDRKIIVVLCGAAAYPASARSTPVEAAISI
jgi:hypothetical protein